MKYVVFVTQEGGRKATRRMSQGQYVRQQTLLNVLTFILGMALGVYLARN